MKEAILKDFDTQKELYETFTLKAASLIREILASHSINVHSVTHRTKDRPSLAKKIQKQGSNYSSLSEVTDISGVRITTYFEDDVDRVVQIIEQEFQIDEQNSVDKRTLLDPDRFGYLSTHHVVSLTSGRCNFPEYRRFKHVKLEIQTRSILQHAWAEIEHDLGYKTKQEVPRAIRRRFSRLAGLLELADSEFIAIRDELATYDKVVVGEIKSRPDLIEIDKSSLIAFIDNSNRVKELDASIAEVGKWKLVRNPESISRDIAKLNFAGIDTIGKLSASLEEHAATIMRFANAWLKDRSSNRDGTISTGISVFYLIYIVVASQGSLAKVIDYLSKCNIGDDEVRTELAEDILREYQKACLT